MNEKRAVKELADRKAEGRETDALVDPCYRCGNPAYAVANGRPVCDLHEREEPTE